MSDWPSPRLRSLVWGNSAAPWLASVHVPPASEGGFEPSDLDAIESPPEATAIRAEGLDQNSFEMLVDRCRERITGLSLFKCPRIEDLTPLESLPQLTHVVVCWNQRATRLWDLAATPRITGLHLTDFKRLRALDDLAAGSSGLAELELGDMPGSLTTVYASLVPLAQLSNLRSLSIAVRRIDDGRVQPLEALTRLEQLRSPINLWTTEQCAWLRAHLPDECQGRVLHATETREDVPGGPRVCVVGKRKPRLDPSEDAERIARYVARYEELVARFRADPTLDP